jgi:hypothetical protein
MIEADPQQTRRIDSNALTYFRLIFCVALAGCSSQQITVTVRDGETGQPLESGRACVANGRMDPLDFTRFGPSCGDISGGKAHVKHVIGRSGSIAVTSPGYIPQWSEATDQGETDCQLFRLPRPTVILIVPAGYRGILKLRFDLSTDRDAYPTGTRRFEFPLKPAAINQFAFSPVLRHVNRHDYQAVYDDGTPIPNSEGANEDQVEWHDVSEADAGGIYPSVELFYVGTKADRREWQRKLQ